MGSPAAASRAGLCSRRVRECRGRFEVWLRLASRGFSGRAVGIFLAHSSDGPTNSGGPDVIFSGRYGARPRRPDRPVAAASRVASHPSKMGPVCGLGRTRPKAECRLSR